MSKKPSPFAHKGIKNNLSTVECVSNVEANKQTNVNGNTNRAIDQTEKALTLMIKRAKRSSNNINNDSAVRRSTTRKKDKNKIKSSTRVQSHKTSKTKRHSSHYKKSSTLFQPFKKRRKSKWQKPFAQPIMRAAVWELRFIQSRIVDTAQRYGIPLRTLRRYRDISVQGGNGYDENGSGTKGVYFEDGSACVRGVPLPPKEVCLYRPDFTWPEYERNEMADKNSIDDSTSKTLKSKSSKINVKKQDAKLIVNKVVAKNAISRIIDSSLPRPTKNQQRQEPEPLITKFSETIKNNSSMRLTANKKSSTNMKKQKQANCDCATELKKMTTFVNRMHSHMLVLQTQMEALNQYCNMQQKQFHSQLQQQQIHAHLQQQVQHQLQQPGNVIAVPHIHPRHVTTAGYTNMNNHPAMMKMMPIGSNAHIPLYYQNTLVQPYGIAGVQLQQPQTHTQQKVQTQQQQKPPIQKQTQT